jgi:arylsulfatase A-like enzyme
MIMITNKIMNMMTIMITNMNFVFRFLLRGAALLGLVYATQLTAVGSGVSAKPNVLLILVDDMGWGDAGFNGGQDIPTPHIDSIAANGVRFVEGYVTAPQCAPSRAGLLTGIDQNRLGLSENSLVQQHGLPVDIPIFSEYLREAGYRTGLVGKWHQGMMPRSRPLVRGFDRFFGHLTGDTHFFPPAGTDTIPHIMDGENPVEVTDYLTFVFGDQAIQFLDDEPDRPFFLFLSFNAPHAPLQAPDDYLEKFAHLAVEGEPGVPCAYTKGHIAHPRQVYAAMVSALDDTIGRVLQALRERGLEENTLIWFLSDNGGPTFVTAACNGPLRGVKGDLLEGGMRVPFAAQWKAAIPAGQTIDMPVSSLDLLPTTLAAAETEIPRNLDGINLLPLLSEGKEPDPRTLTWRFTFPAHFNTFAIRSGEWKLVSEALRGPTGRGWASDRSGKTGLYRISEDIAEENDLSAAYPELLQRMISNYESWKRTLPELPSD